MTLSRIAKIYEKNIDGSSVGLFRIFYGIVLLFEVKHLFDFRQLIFDEIPFIVRHEVDFSIPLIVWMVSILLVIIGYQTRIAAVANYVFSLCIIATLKTYEYHMFYAYVGVNFLLMFLSVNKNYAVDAAIYKIKNGIGDRYLKISSINHFLILFVGIALVYFDSIFHKMGSSLWRNGLGIWLPSSVPQVSIANLYFFLNMKPLVIALGYFVLLFEAIFLFTFFRKKWRPFLFISGIILHLGIAVFYPIPWFALGVCAIYMTMIPVKWLQCLRSFLSSDQKEIITVDESNEGRLVKALVGSFDFRQKINIVQVPGNSVVYDKAYYANIQKHIRFSKFIFRYFNVRSVSQPVAQPLFGFNKLTRVKLIGFGVLALIILQLFSISRSPVAKIILAKTGIQNSTPVNLLNKLSYIVEKYSKVLLGITQHGVFVDLHFQNYNHVIAIEYVEGNKTKWLPIINKDGAPGEYLQGPTWAKWSFRTNNPNIDSLTLSDGIRDFTSFWLHKNGMSTRNARFNIKVKVIDSPDGWESDFLKRQREKEWIDGGEVFWKENKFISNIKDIESL